MTALTKKTLSIAEAAKVLGVSRNFAYAAVHRGEIPSIRIGHKFLVPEEALNRLLSEPTVAPGRRSQSKN